MTMYWMEVRTEFLRLLRSRAFSLATIGFPVMFYLLFGVVAASKGPSGQEAARYLLATYTVFGLVGCSLFGVSVTLAMERSLGWLELKQASPMPVTAYLLSKLLTALTFGLIIFTILLGIAHWMAHITLTGHQIMRMALMVAGGVVPFAALGLMLGMLVPANAATGIINLIYLPMSFLSGLWMPLSVLPNWLQKLAPVWPTYHLAQIAIGSIGFDMATSALSSWMWLAVFSGIMFGLAALLFRRNAARG